MANYNNGYGYNPYQQQYKQYAFVNGIEGAKAFQVMPNQTMLLMDCDKPIVFMKTTDGVGKASIRYFKLVEVSEQELRNANQVQQNQDYVLKSDFDALVKRIDELTNNTKKGGVE